MAVNIKGYSYHVRPVRSILDQITFGDGLLLASLRQFVGPVKYNLANGKKIYPKDSGLLENWKPLKEVPFECDREYPGFRMDNTRFLVLDADNVFETDINGNPILDKDGLPKIQECAKDRYFRFMNMLQEVMSEGTYTEISCSGTGFKMFFCLDGSDEKDRRSMTGNYYFVPKEKRNKNLYGGAHVPQVEFFCGISQQIVVTGQRIRADDTLHILSGEEAAAVFDAINEFKRREDAAERQGTETSWKALHDFDAEELKDALFCIPSDEGATWRQICQACLNCGLSFDTFDAWSQNTQSGNYGGTTELWEHFTKKRARWNAGTVFRLARANGWKPKRKSRRRTGTAVTGTAAAPGQQAGLYGGTVKFNDYPALVCGGNYRITDKIYRVKETMEGEVYELIIDQIVLPVGIAHDVRTGQEKVKLAFKRGFVWSDMYIDRSVIASTTKITSLADHGIYVNAANQKTLSCFLSEMESLNRERLPVELFTPSFGWQKKDGKQIFVPYHENVHFLNDNYLQLKEAVTTCGNETVWRSTVEELRKNPICRTVIAASAASVLIELLGLLPFVVHLWTSESGTGKTVAEMIALSLWGNPAEGALMTSLDSTVNALLNRAAALKNLPYGGDELQTSNETRTGGNHDSLIYRFCEGMDRGRMTKGLSIQKQKIWKNCMISTGEQPIIKSTSKAGAVNRVIQIEVKEMLVQNGHDVAEKIRNNYGFAGKPLISFIQGNLDAVKQRYSEEEKIIAGMDVTPKQAAALACIIVGDYCLTRSRIFEEANEQEFIRYVRGLGRTRKDVDKAARVFEDVKNWIDINGVRFNPDSQENRGEYWGKIDGDYAYINRTVLSNYIAKELQEDFEAMKEPWRQTGRLVLNTQGRYAHQTSLEGHKGTYIKLYLGNDSEAADEIFP